MRPAHTGEPGPMKKPAAFVKLEPKSTPKKKLKPAQAPGSEVAQLAEAQETPAPKPAESPAPKPAEAEAAKPAKALKSDKQALPPPSKAAWNDLKYQCQTLAKKGKAHLQKAWQEAQSQGHMQREIFIIIFSCWILMLHTNKCTKKAYRGKQKNPLWKRGG